MKLLGIKEAKQNKDREDLEKRLRSKEINDEYTERLALLNSLNDEWETSMKRQRDVYAEEKEAHQTWRKSIEKEVTLLEERHGQALSPIKDREQAVALGEGNLRDAVAVMEAEKDGIETLKEILQQRLDEASSSKLQNDQMAQRLSMQEKGIESQAESVRHQSKELSTMMDRFSELANSQQAEVAKQKAEFIAREDGIQVANLRLNDREKELDGREAMLKVREKIAADTFNKYRQYGTSTSSTEEGRQ